MISFAPGLGVVIRDAEWVVCRVDRSSDGGQLLTCDGISELVREPCPEKVIVRLRFAFGSIILRLRLKVNGT